MFEMTKHMVIAIDGPAGSGKSTVSKKVARSLGLLYIDTGAMYRSLTLKAMKHSIDLGNESALTDLARSTRIDLKEADRLEVFMDGDNVTDLIRTPEVTNNIKYIACVPGVRHEMVKLQRLMGKRDGAVMEGRDITTVVFPDADYKFYLDADADERARRRHKELIESGQRVELNIIKEDVIARDKSDFTRSVGPLVKASDAIVIDTTGLSIDEVVNKILAYIKK
ncbi:MAG: (d)CMP kinase [Candidatus Omnitrophota bacterium]|jgi:cytidylate kinase